MLDVNKELTELESNYHDYCNQFNIHFPEGRSDKVAESIDKLLNHFSKEQKTVLELKNEIIELEDQIQAFYEEAAGQDI